MKVKKSNIHSKNTVKVTFTEFFDVKVYFLLPSQHFHCEGLDYLFLPSQHFHCEGFVFTPFWISFTSKVFFRDEYSNFIYLHGVL